jgi:hypothetical protein
MIEEAASYYGVKILCLCYNKGYIELYKTD